MIPTEIHDSDTLLAIEKECNFMGSKCVDPQIATAYRQMSIAAETLRKRTLGLVESRPQGYTCPECNKLVPIRQDGRFLTHRRSCGMSGKLPPEKA